MRIAIVGLGLIGGSLGFDLRRQGHWVLGISRQPPTITSAIAAGSIDQGTIDCSALAQVDLVFLCTPLDVLGSTLANLVPHLAPETIVTDVGSAKGAIVAELEPLWRNFVGGHPMAGKAESGFGAAEAGLFAGKPYVLTPTAHTPPQAITTLETIVQSLGAIVYHCTPEHHDRAVAWISHLPVMVSASLIQACLQEPEAAVLTLARQLASSGFRDTSRVGGGDPKLGVMMATYNRTAVLEGLKVYREQIDRLTQLIEQEDWSTLQILLEQTQTQRPQFL